MTTDATASPPESPARRRLRQRLHEIRDGYGLTLLLTIATIACIALTGFGSVGGIIEVVLAGATLLFALNTSRANPRVMRVAQAFVGISLAVAVIAQLSGDSKLGDFSIAAIGLAIAAIVPVVILLNIVRSPEITYRLVIGALVIYLLIGLCYAYGFAVIALATGQPFFVQTANANSSTFLYFSYVTLSTVGYGDYSAALPIGQLTSVSEAIFGQLYLVSIVAILVANVGRSFRDVKDRDPKVRDAEDRDTSSG